MGRAVYGGIFEPSNEHADEFGCRRDVCDNLKQLGLTRCVIPEEISSRDTTGVMEW